MCLKPLLAKTYQGQPVTGWWMSEKLDGVRAIWTGAELVSRNGNRFAAPDWFLAQLPKQVMLDGELYAGRQAFQTCVGRVRKKTPVDADWRGLHYQVFDAPAVAGGFEARLAAAEQALAGCAVASVVAQTCCADARHLQAFFADLVAQGAEGIMLRRPGSAYEGKRSNHLLKFKPTESDEAEVIGHAAGQGKHAGRLGALVCRWRGVVFQIGTGLSDALREAPPTLGAAVTFAYQGVTDGGVPRFPVFIAGRDYE